MAEHVTEKLVVTENGKPCTDQAEALERFKKACETPRVRLILKVEHFGPDGTTLAPTYRTVDIHHAPLLAALKRTGTYSAVSIIGAEYPDEVKS